MALSVRPGKSFAISAQWLPRRACASIRISSSCVCVCVSVCVCQNIIIPRPFTTDSAQVASQSQRIYIYICTQTHTHTTTCMYVYITSFDHLSFLTLGSICRRFTHIVHQHTFMTCALSCKYYSRQHLHHAANASLSIYTYIPIYLYIHTHTHTHTRTHTHTCMHACCRCSTLVGARDTVINAIIQGNISVMQYAAHAPYTHTHTHTHTQVSQVLKTT